MFTERLALLFQREDIGIEDLHGFHMVRHELRVIGHVFRVVSFLSGDGFRVLLVPTLHPPVHQPQPGSDEQTLSGPYATADP